MLLDRAKRLLCAKVLRCLLPILLAVVAVLFGEGVASAQTALTVDDIVNETVDLDAHIQTAITTLGGIVSAIMVGFVGFKLVKLGARWLGWIRG